MFTCIACTKQTTDERDEEGGVRESGTPSTKEAVKSLTTQVLHLSHTHSSLSLSLSLSLDSPTIFAFPSW